MSCALFNGYSCCCVVVVSETIFLSQATFVSVYVLNELDQKWSRADIEGPLYIVLRSHEP